MSDDASTTGPSDSEAVAELLRQLVDARFLLTDRDGAVTRWSRPAEDLFGWPAARILGRSLMETLGLRAPLPAGGGQLTTVAQRRDGREVEVALGLVPVRMSESLEFNGFLEALEFAAPRGDALAQLGRSHRTVVDWIHAALQGDAQLDDDGLAAGTIVTFRSLDEPAADAAPELGEDGLAADIERILEDAAAELEEIRELAEAARGEAAQATERVTSLEQDEAGLESELANTRSALEAIRTQLETLRGELDDTRAVGEQQSRTDRERLREELDQTRGKVSALETAVSHDRALADRVDQFQARLSGFEGALAEVSGSERIEAVTQIVRSGLAETRAALEALAAGSAAAVERLDAELASSRKGLEQLELATAKAREELSALRSDALERSKDEAGVGALAEQVKASVEAARQAQAAIERLAGQAEEAAGAAGDDSAGAKDAAVAAEARATRAEKAIETAEAEAARANGAAATAAATLTARQKAPGRRTGTPLMRRSRLPRSTTKSDGWPRRPTPPDAERPRLSTPPPAPSRPRSWLAGQPRRPTGSRAPPKRRPGAAGTRPPLRSRGSASVTRSRGPTAAPGGRSVSRAQASTIPDTRWPRRSSTALSASSTSPFPSSSATPKRISRPRYGRRSWTGRTFPSTASR